MWINDICSAIHGQQKKVQLHSVKAQLLFTSKIWTRPCFLIGLSKHFLSPPISSGTSYLTLKKVSGGALSKWDYVSVHHSELHCTLRPIIALFFITVNLNLSMLDISSYQNDCITQVLKEQEIFLIKHWVWRNKVDVKT